jgi:hypothetical protein
VPPCRLRHLAHLGHEVLRAGETAAGDAPELFVEGDVDGVEQIGDPREGPPVEGLAPPESSAVHVRRRAALVGPLDLLDELLPPGKPSTQVSLRKLEEQGGGRLGDRAQILEGDQPELLTDPPADQIVQPLVSAAFVSVDVARGMEQHDPPSSRVRVYSQCQLLGHGAAGQEHRGRLPEKRRHLRLQLRNHAAVAVPVGFDIVGQLGEEVGRPTHPVPGQEARA